HRYRDLDHTSSNHVSHECSTHKRTSSMCFECVDQILISRDEDPHNGKSNRDRSHKGRPQTDRRISGPSHPKESDGQKGSCDHGKNESLFRWQPSTPIFFNFGKLSLIPLVDPWNQSRSPQKSNSDTETATESKN